MSTTTTPLPRAVLDPQSVTLLFATLSHPTGASAQEITARRQEALEWLVELAPRDRMQSALAVRVIAFHHAMLHHLAKAQEEIPDDLALRHAGRAETASRMVDRAMSALLRRQAMAPMRAVAMPAGIGGEMAETAAEAERPAPDMETRQAQAVPAVVVEAAAEAAPPQALVATPVAASPVSAEVPEPVGSAGYVANRLQDLEARLAHGEALTGAQKEWLRRQRARQAEASATTIAA